MLVRCCHLVSTPFRRFWRYLPEPLAGTSIRVGRGELSSCPDWFTTPSFFRPGGTCRTLQVGRQKCWFFNHSGAFFAHSFFSLILVSKRGFGPLRSVFRGTPIVFESAIFSVFWGFPQRVRWVAATGLQGTRSVSWRSRSLEVPAAYMENICSGFEGTCSVLRWDPLASSGVLVECFKDLISMFREVLTAFFQGFSQCVFGDLCNLFPWIFAFFLGVISNKFLGLASRNIHIGFQVWFRLVFLVACDSFFLCRHLGSWEKNWVLAEGSKVLEI